MVDEALELVRLLFLFQSSSSKLVFLNMSFPFGIEKARIALDTRAKNELLEVEVETVQGSQVVLDFLRQVELEVLHEANLLDRRKVYEGHPRHRRRRRHDDRS